MTSRRFKIVTVIGVVALVVLLFLVSPIFSVQEVIISGQLRVSDADIRSRLDVNNTTNLLFLNTNAARRRIMENLYVGDVVFQRVPPGRLYVTVHERRPAAYVEHMPGSFLLLDDFGRVLEVRSYGTNQLLTEHLPVLVGLEFTRFRLGEILEVPDEVSFGTVVQYAQLLNQHGIINQVSHMNVADPSSIRILIRYKEFDVGDVMGADEKVRTIAQILEETPEIENLRGFVEIRQGRNEHFFKILQ